MAPARYIDEPTRDRLARLAAAAEKAVHARDLAIMEAVEAGISLRTVGDVVGLAHTTVQQIAVRTRAELDG